MKIARFFAVIFGILGTILLLGSFGLCLLFRNAPVRIVQLPEAAVNASDAFSQALNDGDLTSAAALIYGQPELGTETVPADPETEAIWNAFLESISLEYTGKCYATENGLARSGTITTLDVAALTAKLPERTQALINQRIIAAEDLSEIYDDQNQFRQELVTEILAQALQQALAEDAKTITREVTLQLVNRDGSWWVVPDQALLQAISGVA